MGKKKNKKKQEALYEIDLTQAIEIGFNEVDGSDSYGNDQIQNVTLDDNSIFSGPKGEDDNFQITYNFSGPVFIKQYMIRLQNGDERNQDPMIWKLENESGKVIAAQDDED